MELRKSIKAFFAAIFSPLIGPSGEVGIIECNGRGGFSIREFDQAVGVGNYPSFEAAASVARLNGLEPQFNERPPSAAEPIKSALKYVIVEEPRGPERILFCLSPMTLVELAAICGRATGSKPVSAGFVTFRPDGAAETFGESISLRLKPRATDARLITVMSQATLGTCQIAGLPDLQHV
jgi:hypothetical protein